MGLFESLIGAATGGRQQQQQRQQEYQDFVGRYEQGRPWEGISDQEAVQRYQQVAAQLPPDEYRQSAEEAFARLTPQERQEFGRFLQQRARQQGVNVPGLDLNRDGIDDRLQDSGYLAEAAGRLDQQQPGLLGQLLGGGASAGGRAAGRPGPAGPGGAGNLGEVLNNPLAKAALAGIAAVAVKRMMSNR